MEKKQCLICGSHALLIEENYPGYQEPDTFNIYECQNCNTSFSLPFDSQNVYENIYRNSEKIPGYNRYVFYYKKVKTKKNPLEYIANIEEAYWAVKEALLINNISGKIIEVGSGLGYLTYSLRKEGYDVLGLDISKTAVSHAINKFGKYYFCEDANNYADDHEGEYDAIILTEVIEHIEDPITFLKSLMKMLKDGGSIILTTPNKTFFNNSDSFSWITELPPVHYYWFSEESMKYISILLQADISFVDFTDYYLKKDKFIFEDDLIFNPEPFLDKNGLLRRKYDNNSILFNIKFSLSRINFFVKFNKLLFKRSKILSSYKFGKRGTTLGCIFKK